MMAGLRIETGGEERRAEQRRGGRDARDLRQSEAEQATHISVSSERGNSMSVAPSACLRRPILSLPSVKTNTSQCRQRERERERERA